jgi:tetratricopeptide (TPR) repeat protein
MLFAPLSLVGLISLFSMQPCFGILAKSGIFFAKVMVPLITISGILPSREQLPTISIPTAIAKLHPLPEEELTTSYNRGNAYLMSGRFQDALVEFNRAADVRPDVADVYISRGIVNEKLFRWDDAITDYRKANDLLRKRPFAGDDPTVFSNIANAETGLNRWEDALKDFTYAAQLKSDYLAPQIGRALVLYQLDRKDEAIAFFKTLSIKYPAFADGLAALAVMDFDKGLVDEAKDAWETALEQDSRYEDIDWVLNIRRWPPKLVDSLVVMKKGIISN